METRMEMQQRAANIGRFISMILFVAGLLFFYAYASDAIGRSITHDYYILQLPKSLIFYTLLGIFALFNIIMNVSVKMYKSSRGINPASRLFHSERQKAAITFWITLTIAGFNLLLSGFLVYVASVRIEEMSAMTGYIIVPALGILFFVVPFTGLVVTLLSKK